MRLQRHRLVRRVARAAAMLLLLLLLLLASPGVAGAQAPPARVTQPLTDAAEVLDAAQEQAVARTLTQGRQTGVDLHALLIRSTGGAPVTGYAEDVAIASSMGGDDALLVVAFDDRTYALWTSERFPVGPAEIETILDRWVAPELRAGDVAGAVAAALDGLRAADSATGPAGAPGGQAPAAPPGEQPVRPSGRAVPWLPLALLGAGAVFLVSRVRERRDLKEARARQSAELEALAAEANSALVRVDDALRDAAHEVGFAEAQFGPEEGAALRAGLDEARGELQHAFQIRQRLDDDEPEPPQERRALLEAVAAHADAAEALLEEGLSRLEELRGIERDPAGARDALRVRAEQAAQRLPGVQTAALTLAVSAPAVAAAVEGNVTEAEKRLVFVRERLHDADGAGAAEIARNLRAAGAALAQAEELLDAVDDLTERVRAAREDLPRELREAELARARAEDFVRSRRHVVGREARTRLAEAQRHADRARELAAADPAAATEEADAAERLADEAFELAQRDSETGGGDGGHAGHGGVRGFGWGLPIPIPFPFPGGGGIGWGGSPWGSGGSVGGGGFGGSVGGGGFGGGSVGGGRW